MDDSQGHRGRLSIEYFHGLIERPYSMEEMEGLIDQLAEHAQQMLSEDRGIGAFCVMAAPFNKERVLDEAYALVSFPLTFTRDMELLPKVVRDIASDFQAVFVLTMVQAQARKFVAKETRKEVQQAAMDDDFDRLMDLAEAGGAETLETLVMRWEEDWSHSPPASGVLYFPIIESEEGRKLGEREELDSNEFEMGTLVGLLPPKTEYVLH